MVREREDRYRALVESNPAAVLHLDADGRIIYVNPVVSEVTGYDKTDIFSRRWSLPDLCPEDERRPLEEAAQDALRGVPRRGVQFTVVRKDGARRWVTASLQPLADDEGTRRSVVVLLSDDTEDREIEERLRQSEKLSSLGTLVSGVAHELNNPLAGILGYAQLLLDRPSERWTRAEVEKIERNAHRCQRIVENLLAFSRQSRMTKRLANLNDVIQSVVRLNEYQFRMDDIEIQTSFDPRVQPLHVDVTRWQQVFVNLATNARDAMVAAGSALRVLRFETRWDGGRLVIRVSDTGPGVPEGLRARIFEPFFTTKETGTGLGLGICWGIVRDHGGTIEIEPPGEGGAAFRIALPVSHPEVAPVEPPVEEGPALTELGAGKRVLVVDDDASVRDVVVRALENHRYAVDVAADGAGALVHVRSAAYDVVLTDVRMPGEMDGIDFFERVRDEMPQLASRIVFLTGNTLDDEGMDRLERLGARCVEKPFDIHHLARVVHDVAGAIPTDTARTVSP
jgi:two-component system NtrC family sensor kinase